MVEHERLEPLARLDRKGRWLLECAADFRRVDAEKTNPPHSGRINGVAVDDAGDESDELAVARRRGKQKRDEEVSHAVA